MGSKPLVGAMVKSTNQNVRRMAAGYLASVQGDVASQVIKAYAFRKGAKKVPWDGGALFLPGIKWSKKDARALVGNLIRWHLWAEINGKQDLQKQIHNNLRSVQLVRAAGYRNPSWQPIGTDKWLQTWGKVVGRRGIRAILKQQGVRWKRRYRAVLLNID